MATPADPCSTCFQQFRDTAGVRQTPHQRATLLAFLRREYAARRCLRELGALTGGSQNAAATAPPKRVRAGGAASRPDPEPVATAQV